MANTKREKLFTEFPPVPTEKWEEVITAWSRVDSRCKSR